MSTERLICKYGRARDALQELRFLLGRMPEHFKACTNDLKRGKRISPDDIEYQGRCLKQRASDALIAIGELHAVATEVFPAETNEEEKAA